MISTQKDLKSNNTVDYLIITLFLLTYRQKKNYYYIGVLSDIFKNIKTELQLPQSSEKTIHVFRKEILTAIATNYFPGTDITPKDNIDLSTLFETIAAILNLDLPDSLGQDLKTIAPQLADDLITLPDSILDYFSNLASDNKAIYTYDISFIILLVLDFIEKHYLSKYSDCFTSLKEKLLSSFADKFFPNSDPDKSEQLVKIPENIFLPRPLLDLITSKKSFIIIHDTLYNEILEYGETKRLLPKFEKSVRESFSGRPYSDDFQVFFYKIVNLIIQSTDFRIELKNMVNSYLEKVPLDLDVEKTKAHDIPA